MPMFAILEPDGLCKVRSALCRHLAVKVGASPVEGALTGHHDHVGGRDGHVGDPLAQHCLQTLRVLHT